MTAVEAADMGVVGENQRKLAFGRNPRLDCSDGGIHNFCDKRRQIRLGRPVAGLDQEIDSNPRSAGSALPLGGRLQIPSPRFTVAAVS